MDSSRVSPFPKNISLLSLSASNLYNRRMANSKDNVISSSQNLDYEELAWNVVNKPFPNPDRNFQNFYGPNAKIKPVSNNTDRYIFINCLI